MLSYWTAYLKAHYPAEYMAALLTSVGDARDKLALYLNECRRMGIKVLPPDVNESIGFFAAVGDDIRFGLGAVRNVGFNVVDAIRGAREAKGGRFESFHDFLKKVPIQVANKRTVESLVKAGGVRFARPHATRARRDPRGAVESAVKEKRAEEVGDVGFDFDSLFEDHEREAAPSLVPDRPEWAKKDKLAFEREMLGLYVSDHPLAGARGAAREARLDVDPRPHRVGFDAGRDTVVIAGLVTSVQHRIAKNSGNQYGMIQVEDFSGEITVMFMGKAYQEFAPALKSDSIVVVRGRVSLRDDGMNLHAHSVFQPDLGQGEENGPVLISIPRCARDDRHDRRARRRAHPPPRRHRGASSPDQGAHCARVRAALPRAGERRLLR